jgi:hypothetical protein
MTDTMTTNTVPATYVEDFPAEREKVVDLVDDDESLEEGEIPSSGGERIIYHEDRTPRPEAVAVPTLDDHRGRGILAGDFVKPDPVMTRQETRRYVVAELRRWLTESAIASHAREIAGTVVEPADVAPLVAAGRWPAARLYLVLAGLEALPRGVVELPRDYEERFHAAARWAADVCEDYLHGYEAVIPAARMAVGFVTDDLLPDGSTTIASFWNHSPFEALRNAPPLPDDDPPEQLGFLKQEFGQPVGLSVQALHGFMGRELVLRFTGGQLAAFVAAVVAYLWLVAALVGRR